MAKFELAGVKSRTPHTNGSKRHVAARSGSVGGSGG